MFPATFGPDRTLAKNARTDILTRSVSEELRRKPTLSSLTLFEVAHFLSPRGTAAESLGREPQEKQNETESSPERATQVPAFTPVSPLQGLEVLFGNNSWGSRPRLSAVTASRLNSATSKLTRRVTQIYNLRRNTSDSPITGPARHSRSQVVYFYNCVFITIDAALTV